MGGSFIGGFTVFYFCANIYTCILLTIIRCESTYVHVSRITLFFHCTGKRFASPIKPGERSDRAKGREINKYMREHSCTPSTSESIKSVSPPAEQTVEPSGSSMITPPSPPDLECQSALLARIELLELENSQLKCKSKVNYFRIEDIQDNDKLITFYTGFVSYMVLIAFFKFLGPVVNNLTYWGSQNKTGRRCRCLKLDPLNQFFLVLVKLKLNLKIKDLAYRFGLSPSQTSRYITTWICLLYQHLKEINWMPSVDQVMGTLPTVFREKFPSTYAIIDGSEVFMETPSDLVMQSSTWSQYKQHNTCKFLVACTPNGAICFVSPVYVGSISDVQLTRESGFLDAMKDKPGVSIMADKGFTVEGLLKEIDVGLNIPAFLHDKQFSEADVNKGRKIASVRIHIERAIGRIKTFQILKGTIPISLARLTNQIIFVCAFLTNFLPALVPLPATDHESDEDVEEYFTHLSDSDTDSFTSDSDLESDCDL